MYNNSKLEWLIYLQKKYYTLYTIFSNSLTTYRQYHYVSYESTINLFKGDLKVKRG